MSDDWQTLLSSAVPEEQLEDIRRHAQAGRPLGEATFLGRLEEMVDRVLGPQKRGPKRKHVN
jgi:hypothetical protein